MCTRGVQDSATPNLNASFLSFGGRQEEYLFLIHVTSWPQRKPSSCGRSQVPSTKLVCPIWFCSLLGELSMA